jgi:glycosyltransferase involved in cell wall biosynthesis
MNKNLKFTIIIPSYNEKEDVRLAIESSIKQRYPDKEILVIDDSTDNTPQIIREYVSRGVVLLNGPRKGCCGARNFGIKKASGDVVVLLNADVVLPPDFLEKIKKHYEAGADYVLVESQVFNQENIWARFIEMQHRYESRKIGDKAEWTEGFSCRREAALKVGLIPGDFPIRFCRDWFLGKRLNEAGFKKVIDRSIIVTHKAPDNFKEYWQVRKVRGRFSALTQYFLLKKSRKFLAMKFLVKHSLFILEFILVIPVLLKIFKIASFSKNFFRDFFLFLHAYFIQRMAFILGEWQGWLIICNLIKDKRNFK